MAERSDQTIKEMLAGFSAMQFNLGLLPMQTTQAMAGAPMQMPPPPPPPIMHPAQAASNAIAQQQALMQQTMQAAQMTRYQPPPSAPTPAVSAMGAFGAMNPFAAPPVGGGVGFAPGGNVPGRPLGGPSLSPQIGSVFNPFAPTLPQAHFATPAQRNLQIMHTAHSQMMGTVAGIGEAGMGIAGSVVGGALGSFFGPLGTMAGSWLGGKIGGAASNMMFGPGVQDMARGRQIQAMSAPFMVSGGFVNSATGQGFNPYAARQAATGIRGLQRDYDFERTGFNTQDTMQIMQQSASHGLFNGVQSPDALVAKVKEISKTVKVLMRITGDPDVRSAIQSLGEMKDLGFSGLGAQAGAVANRAMFARMAGVSQAQAGAYGMMGAGVASQFGLGGATGYSAGLSGAALANMATSSGALNDLQLARAGGKSGLAQINATGQLAAMQDERYLLAAMGRDGKGNMTVDMNAYRRAQSMSFQEVSERASEALRTMGKEGIFEWNTRKQEFKDQVSQKLSPLEMNMNMVRQAQAFKNQVPGMTMGTALQMTTGMGADQARALELQVTNRGWYDAQVQQLEVSKRQAQDQLRAQREQYRTPGFMTRVGRGVSDFFGGISDSLSSPFTRLGEHFQRVSEDDEAAERGQHIVRISDLGIAHSAGERSMMRNALRSDRFRASYAQAGSNFLDGGDGSLGGAFAHAGSRQLNRMGSFLGLSTMNDENRLVSAASRSYGSAFGYHPLASFGDAGEAMERVKGVIGASRAALDSETYDAKAAGAMRRSIESAGSARGKNVNSTTIITNATQKLVSRLKDLKAGVVDSASAVSESDLKAAYVKAATEGGLSPADAERSYEQNKKSINAAMARDVYASGDHGLIETFEKSKETAEAAGAVNLGRSRAQVQSDISSDMRKLGLDQTISVGGMTGGYKASEKTLRNLKSVVADNDESVVSLAAAKSALVSGSEKGRQHAQQVINDMRKNLGADKFEEVEAKAAALQRTMGSDTQQALRQSVLGATDMKGMSAQIGAMKGMFGTMMARDATSAFLQTLDSKQKGLGGSKTAEEAIRNLDDDTISSMGDKKFADILRRAKKGEKGALEEAVEYAAPSNTDSRYGGAAGASIDDIERLQGQAKDLRDAVGKDKGSEKDQLQSVSAELFSSAVERFGKYVNDVVGGGEGTMLDRANPYNQAAK